MKRLHIVQVISNYPDAQKLPPTNQGGTEKVVHELTESLVRKGHKVILFAAKGSRTRARLIPFPKGLRDAGIGGYVLRKLPPRVDVIHDHTFTSALGTRKLRIPTVCTMHLPVRQRVKHPVYVSRRAKMVMGNNRGYFIYNGINPNEYEFSSKKSDVMVFMGRILREKGVLHAIEIAEKTNRKLIIAGPVKDAALFRKEIMPRIRSNPNIKFVGPVGGRRKQKLLKHASCLLFPTVWEEPFGLVMIEAMACGTPVIALNHGAVPEVMAGFPELICRSVPEMIAKVKQGRFPEPAALRRYVIRRFSTSRMTNRYLAVYRKAMKK
ncbi:glycosyltransferase family 4 protein [Paenibacillus sp. GCM10023248]|uniref:glycosyltransferase family 4 protein n=1 Tax=unclassified Paenibacillus TaxID=185978 RepID=UPI002378F9AC|nr:glycosyltransferase family 4 protein [Paenibacillus sp. MAHUQ-63]MDD9268750.1 glycosyltransferase family 4 protein [Paenibacillus sp. MAHUQ-63]